MAPLVNTRPFLVITPSGPTSPAVWVFGYTGATDGNGTSTTNSRPITVDGSDNNYLADTTTPTSEGLSAFREILLMKFDVNGTILHQSRLGGDNNTIGIGSGSVEDLYDMIRDSATGNVYLAGKTNATWDGGASTWGSLLAKYDNTLSLVWQVSFSTTTPPSWPSDAIDIGSATELYVGAGGASQSGHFAKINPTPNPPTITWQQKLVHTGASTALSRIQKVKVNASGDIFTAGWASILGGPNGQDVLIAKWDSSGNLLWHSIIGGSAGTSNLDEAFGMDFDSNGDVFVTGRITSTGQGKFGTGTNTNVFLFKLNGTTGAVIFQKAIGNTYASLGFDLVVDSSDDVYIAGYLQFFTSPNNRNDMLVVKVAGDGSSILWQRGIGDQSVSTFPTARDTSGTGITLDASESNVIVHGITNLAPAAPNNQRLVIAILPTSDGGTLNPTGIGGSGFKLHNPGLGIQNTTYTPTTYLQTGTPTAFETFAVVVRGLDEPTSNVPAPIIYT